MKAIMVPTVLVLAMGMGCHTSAAAHDAAPFVNPPMLTGAPDVATLVAKVKLAVVNITITKDTGDEDAFGREGRQQALGSGILVDPQGHVVTNAHVVDGASVVEVKLSDEREYRAKVVGKDDRLDLAVVQLENAPHDLPYASLGSSEALRVGEYVVAIGNPFGLGNTVTMGIVSAKGRSLGAGPYDDFIQTDASINPGNSGGPLFDLHGQVIGINSAINPAGKGIGFAIPIDEVKQVLPELIAKGHVSRGQLGVVIQGMDDGIAKALGMDKAHGALVEEVNPHGAGDKAGLHAGDVIVTVDGHDVARSMDLPRMIASHAPGSRVRLGVLREGHAQTLDATLDPFASEVGAKPGASSDHDRATGPRLGMSMHDEDGHAVVDRVEANGPAEGKVVPGDVIEEVDRAAVTSASEVATRLRAAPTGHPVLLKVRHGEHSRYVAITREG
jgi:serine protease Do